MNATETKMTKIYAGSPCDDCGDIVRDLVDGLCSDCVLPATTPAPTKANTYRVPVGNLDALEARIAKLAKRAVKLGSDPITLTRGAVEIEPGRINPDTQVRSPDRVYQVVTVVGPEPKIAGWTFVAVLQHEGAGTIVRSVPTVEISDGELRRYREAGADCDHCGFDRRRKDTYVLRGSVDGTLVQVGRTCLKDFVGHGDPESIAKIACLLGAIDEACGGYDEEGRCGSSDEDCFSTRDLVSTAIAVVGSYGWMSRGKARMDGTTATADRALALLNDPKEIGRVREVYPKFEITDGHRERAERVLANADERLEVLGDARNDYEHNLWVSLQSGFVTGRSAGLAASVIGYVQRAEAKEAQVAAEAAEHNDTYLGAEGERLDVVAKVFFTYCWEGEYGATTIVKMRTETGQELHWFASGDRTDEPRDVVRHAVVGVKRHKVDDRSGRKVTQVARVTFGDVDAFRDAVAGDCPTCAKRGGVAGTWCRTPKGRASKIHSRRAKV